MATRYLDHTVKKRRLDGAIVLSSIIRDGEEVIESSSHPVDSVPSPDPEPSGGVDEAQVQAIVESYLDQNPTSGGSGSTPVAYVRTGNVLTPSPLSSDPAGGLFINTSSPALSAHRVKAAPPAGSSYEVPARPWYYWKPSDFTLTEMVDGGAYGPNSAQVGILPGAASNNGEVDFPSALSSGAAQLAVRPLCAVEDMTLPSAYFIISNIGNDTADLRQVIMPVVTFDLTGDMTVLGFPGRTSGKLVQSLLWPSNNLLADAAANYATTNHKSVNDGNQEVWLPALSKSYVEEQAQMQLDGLAAYPQLHLEVLDYGFAIDPGSVGTSGIQMMFTAFTNSPETDWLKSWESVGDLIS